MVIEDNKISSVIRDTEELFNDRGILKHAIRQDEPH